jgi:hypothetical protein
VNSFVIVSLPKNNLGIPVGVNQILFGVLMINWLISVLIHGAFKFAENAKFCPFPNLAKFRKKLRKSIVIISGANSEIQFFFFGWKKFNSNEFNTTETELIAIANPANSGFNVNPRVASTPAAIGIHKVL